MRGEAYPTINLSYPLPIPWDKRTKQLVLLAARAQAHHTLALCPGCPSGSPAPAAPPASRPLEQPPVASAARNPACRAVATATWPSDPAPRRCAACTAPSSRSAPPPAPRAAPINGSPLRQSVGRDVTGTDLQPPAPRDKPEYASRPRHPDRARRGRASPAITRATRERVTLRFLLAQRIGLSRRA